MQVRVIQAGTSQNERKREEQAATEAASPKAAPVSPEKLFASVTARLAKLRQTSNQKVNQNVVEVIAGLKGAEQETLDMIEAENELKETFREGTLDYTEAGRRISQYTSIKNEVQGQLRKYADDPEYARAYQEASQLMNLRRQAQIVTNKIVKDRSQSFNKETASLITNAVDSAFDSNFIVKTVEGETATFIWKRQGYRSARPNDPVVSGVAAEIVTFITEFQQDRDARNDEVLDRTRRDGFLIGTRRELKDPANPRGEKLPSELDLIEEEAGMVRSLTGFCVAGKGQKVLVRLPDRQGEVLLERTGEGEAVPTRATNARVADSLFYWNDRTTGERRPKDRVYPINLTDLNFSEVRPYWFGEAMVNQIIQEKQSQENWQKAEDLRDVSQVKDFITAQGLTHLKEIGTSVIDGRPTLTIGEKTREFDLTLHVAGLPNDMFQVTQYIEGSVQKVDPDSKWLQPAIETPQSRRLLREVAEWKTVTKANEWSDSDVLVAQEAERLGAVTVTRENQDQLFSLDKEKGKDGKYVVRATDKRFVGKDKMGMAQYVFQPVRIIVERTNSESGDPDIEIVYAVPFGKSADLARRCKGKHKRANLPNDLRFPLGNVYYLVNRTRENPHVETPDDLRAVKKNQTKE